MATIRQGIVNDAEVRRNINNGYSFVDMIIESEAVVVELKKALTDITNEEREIDEELDRIESEVTYELTMAYDDPENEHGKMTVDKRKVVLAHDLLNNEEMKAIRARTSRQAIRKNEVLMKIDIEKARAKALEYQMALWKSQMAVIAGLSREQEQEVRFNHILTMETKNGREKD